jgi:Tfp pilus assembly protein PilF
MNTACLKKHFLSIALMVTAGILGFWGTLNVPFLYDDAHAIVQNPDTWSPTPAKDLLQWSQWFHRPVLLLTFAWNRAWGGLEVTGYHLVNLGLHLGVGIAFYFLIQTALELVEQDRRTIWKWLPLLAAMIHVLHPLNSQAVIYLSSRSSLLATFFYLLGFLCWMRLLKPWEKPLAQPMGIVLLVLGGVFFVLGCGTKAIIFTLPIMALIYHTLICSGENRKADSTLVMFILAPVFIYLVFRAMSLGNLLVLPTEPESMQVSRTLYALTQIKAFVFYYVLKGLFPINLNFEPDVRLVSGFGDPGWWVGAGVLAVTCIALYRSRSRLLQFGFLWMVITLAPTSSIIPLKQIVTDHRFYLPGLGLHLMMAMGWILAARSTRWAGGAIPVYLLCLFLLTGSRGNDYQSAITLWEDTARKSPRKALVHNNLATAYLDEKRYEDAIQSLRRTLELNPKSDHAHINLGFILIQKKQYEKALEEFYQAIQGGTGNPAAYYNAGLALAQLDRAKEGIPYLEEAVRLNPRSAAYHFDLGKTYQQARMNDEALKAYRASLRIQPDNPKAFNNIGTIFWELKSFYFAEASFQQAYQLDNTSVTTLNNLISANMILQQYDAAIQYAQRLLEIKPDDENARQLMIAAKRLKTTRGPAPPIHGP